MKITKTQHQGIFKIELNKKTFLATKNLTPKKTFFDERTFKKNNIEYREFNPSRSKLAAGIKKGIKKTPIKQGDNILYLGAAHGYTPSFISDIIGKKGTVFCIEFAPRASKELVFLCEKKPNMAPIFANANKPETYKNRIKQIDLIYQDIAQKNQVDILIKNSRFLKKGGYLLLALKTRSIDVTKKPKEILKEILKNLEMAFKIEDFKDLGPFEKDHYFFILKKE